MRLIGCMRISRKHFYLIGGFSNPDLFRRMVGRSWQYFETF